MTDRFTSRARKITVIAQDESKKLGHSYVGVEHLLLALLNLKEGIAYQVLLSLELKVEINVIKSELEKLMGKGNNSSVIVLGEIPFANDAKDVFEIAKQQSENLGCNYIGTEHILLGIILSKNSIAANLLKKSGCSAKDILLKIEFSLQEQSQMRSYALGKDQKRKESKQSILHEFSKDLTQLAKKNALDKMIGRDEHIERLIRILCRRTKNNPILIGDPGVGKTAIVEGLAQRIEERLVPDILLDKKVILLDMVAVISGTKYRGEFEQRMRMILDEVIQANRSIILFLDEVHTIVGAGSAEGNLDASNLLKPSLARGELQCIGSTTFSEYRKHIEHDPALARRFQPIYVNPLSVEQTVEVLHGLKSTYSEFHHVDYDDSAIMMAASLSERYITDRHLPDKAIDLIDEAGSAAKIKKMRCPSEFKTLEKEIKLLSDEKDNAIFLQEYERAAKIRDQEKSKIASLEKNKKQWQQKNNASETVRILGDDIATIVSQWTKIPVTKLNEDEMSRFARMENELKKSIINQDEAISAVSRSIRRNVTGIKDPSKPIGTFMFLGSSGVGKTELAKVLAQFLFGNEKNLIRIDMSEYMEKISMTRLIGSPPGYVGFEEGGQLSEKVRKQPYSVILLDEIEKAHPDIWNLLLQIMDNGTLNDNLGHEVSFKNCIIIMTSNVGSQFFTKNNSLGFLESSQKDNYKSIKSSVFSEVKKTFKAEFLNRIDNLIVFKSLDKGDMLKIYDLLLMRLNQRIKDKNYQLVCEPSIKEHLINTNYDFKQGARTLLVNIQQYLEESLAEEILERRIPLNSKKKMSIISVKWDKRKKKVIFNIKDD